MKKTFISAFILSALLAFTSCSNSNKTADSHDGHEHHDHDGHDHSGHDHSHDHDNDHGQHTENTNTQQTNTAELDMQKAPAASIPAFKFYKVKSGVSFTNDDIAKGKKSVFILFDPSCSHCRSEATGLGKNYDKIKDVNIYFVSMNDPALMATFLETFGKELVNKPNVEVLYDRDQDFIQKFHIPKQFPANYVYGADGALQASWDGEKNISDIIAAYTK